MTPDTSPSVPFTRRRFLSQGGATLAAPAILTAVGSLRAQQKADSNETLKVGLIGCGGRGTGAAAQALAADYNTRLVAVADVFERQIEVALGSLSTKHPDRVSVAPDMRFVGMDAFRQLLATDIDVVLLATPPGFRPLHLEAAVEAGKHIFAEKPMAVDAVGYRLAQAALAKAKEKRINVVAGLCWRYSTSRREVFKQLREGAVGDLCGYFGTFYTSPVKPMPAASARPEGMSDVEWQLANWYNFSWLSGDGYVEQAVHSVDKMAWAFDDVPPVSCVATGGRQIPSEGGNIFDHFHCAYEFPNGVVAHIGTRQIPGCQNENSDLIQGSKGRIVMGRGTAPFIEGENRWRYRGDEKPMHQIEHDELFAAIRAGEPIYDGDWMMQSTLMGIMGREAAYTGQRLTWEQMLNSEQDLAPDTLGFGDAFTPTPMPMPGVTRFV